MRKVLVLSAAFALGMALFIGLRGSGGTMLAATAGAAAPAIDSQGNKTCSPPPSLTGSSRALKASGPTATPEGSQGGSNIPDCPAVFSSCVNVAHKRCGLRNPVTTNTGDRRCRQPDGSIFQCAGPQRIHVTTQSCVETLLEICCLDGTCSPPPCGTCTGGSQTFSCQ